MHMAGLHSDLEIEHLLGESGAGICIFEPLLVPGLIELTRLRLGKKREGMKLQGGGVARPSSESFSHSELGDPTTATEFPRDEYSPCSATPTKEHTGGCFLIESEVFQAFP